MIIKSIKLKIKLKNIVNLTSKIINIYINNLQQISSTLMIMKIQKKLIRL
jgi:hypothetical protein